MFKQQFFTTFFNSHMFPKNLNNITRNYYSNIQLVKSIDDNFHKASNFVLVLITFTKHKQYYYIQHLLNSPIFYKQRLSVCSGIFTILDEED